MTVRRPRLSIIAAFAGFALIAAACGELGTDESSEPLEPAEASQRLDELADEIGWIDNQVTRSASIPPPTGANLADTLPAIDEFEIMVPAPGGA